MTDQRQVTDYIEDPDALFGDARDYMSGLIGAVNTRLQDVGIDLDWWTESPLGLDTDEDVWAFQYVVAYSKGELGGRYNFDPDAGNKSVRKGSPSPEIQFKTGIHVLGKPSGGLEERFRDVDNPRLVTLFNTREYAGYMDGFGFQEKEVYIQKERVSAREAQQKGYGLGVPWFEVEAYDEEGNLSGFADGHFNPFTSESYTTETVTGEPTPEAEVWRVRSSLNRARSAGGQWDIGPEGDTGASERTRAPETRGKDVYIGPFKIGTVTKRGTAWLRREYASGGKYTDKATITSQSGIPPQALQKGAKLYKHRETPDAIYLSTTEPTDFDAVDPDDISPGATGEKVTVDEVTDVFLDDGEPTQFTVETDTRNLPDGRTGRLLGLYDPVVVREIDTETDLVFG